MVRRHPPAVIFEAPETVPYRIGPLNQLLNSVLRRLYLSRLRIPVLFGTMAAMLCTAQTDHYPELP